MSKNGLSSFHRPRRKYRAFRSYWRAMGGWPELLNSPWLGFALLLTIILFPLWSKFEGSEFPWISIPINTIPSLLGFSIGASAILLGFSAGPRKALHKERGSSSYYLKLLASFFHFSLLQFLALTFSLITTSYPNIFLSGLTFFIYAYSIFSGIGSASMIFSVSEIFDKHERQASNSENDL